MGLTIAATNRVTEEGFAEQRPLSLESRGGKLPTFTDERTFVFYLGAHKSSWELAETEDGWRLLPVVKRLVAKPGFWTKNAAKGETVPDASLLLSKADRFGFNVLRSNENYLYQVDGRTQNGSRCTGYFAQWEKVRLYEDGAHEVVIDHAARHAFLDGLVASGTVAAPREGTLAEMRSRMAKHVSRAKQRKDEDALALASKRLAGFDEAVARLRSPPPAKGKAKARPPAAAEAES